MVKLFGILSLLYILFVYFIELYAYNRRPIFTVDRNLDKKYDIQRVYDYSRNDETENEIYWVAATIGQGHAQTCLRYGFKPTHSILLPWNKTTMYNAIRSLNILNLTMLPNEFDGCCAPGLWCSPTGCFTQSYGSYFSNYGWLNDTSKIPIFTCIAASYATDDDNKAADDYNGENWLNSIQYPHIQSSTYSSGVVNIYGTNFGEDENKITADIIGESCTNSTLCSRVCSRCDSGECPKDSICLLGPNKKANCFMYCSGTDDTSCPCDTFCDKVDVRISYEFAATMLTIHMCTPKTLETSPSINVCSGYNNDENRISCMAPRAGFTYNALKTESPNLQPTTTLSVEHEASTEVFLHENDLNGWCTHHSDCYDGNICTLDECQHHNCNYTVLQGCETTAQKVRERTAPFAYRGWVQSNQYYTHSLFESFLLKNGRVSYISNSDDFPLHYLSLDFSYNYFGNMVRSISINPNGVLHIPPIKKCNSDFSSIQCIIYSTDTNIISLWASDWDLSRSAASKVYYYSSPKRRDQRNPDVSFDSCDAEDYSCRALHVLFHNVYHYNDLSAREAHPVPSSFGASIYEDGSIRLRYLSVHKNSIRSSDIFGLWGSRASQDKDASRKYHSEDIPLKFIKNGTDIVYCPVSTLACLQNACVTPGENLTIFWNGAGSSCYALGEAALSVTCEWGGGISSTPAYRTVAGGTGEASGGREVVVCLVPELPFVTDTVLAVDLLVSETGGGGGGGGGSEGLQLEDGSRSVYGMTLSNGHELARTHIMVRYLVNRQVDPLAGNITNRCGCSALPAHEGLLVCDQCLVCGGGNSTKDCRGDCFGSAYHDTCKYCAGGMSGRVPVGSCEDSMDLLSSKLFTDIIIALSIVCSVMFVLTTFLWTFRTAVNDFFPAEPINLRFLGLPHIDILRRGLTERELTAIGEFQYAGEASSHVVSGNGGGADSTSEDTRSEGSSSDHHHRPVLNPLIAQLQSHSTTTTTAASSHPRATTSVSSPSPSVVSTTSLDPLTAPPLPPPASECPICLAEFSLGDICRRFPHPCGHKFHKVCIDAWVRSSVLCPLCKRSIRNILQPLLVERGVAGGDSDDIEMMDFHFESNNGNEGFGNISQNTASTATTGNTNATSSILSTATQNLLHRASSLRNENGTTATGLPVERPFPLSNSNSNNAYSISSNRFEVLPMDEPIASNLQNRNSSSGGGSTSSVNTRGDQPI